MERSTPSLAGGNDFAFGGATTGRREIDPVNPLPIDLPDQIEAYAVEHPIAGSNGALYTLDIGANDILDALGSGTIKLGLPDTSSQQAEANTVDAVEESAHDLGARSLLFYEVAEPRPHARDSIDYRGGFNPSPAASRCRSTRPCSAISTPLETGADPSRCYDLDTYDRLD